jgi:HEAT repeat protein
VNTAWTIDVLIEKLKGPDPFVRVHAAMLLGNRGGEAGAAVPALIALLENGDLQDRRLAALTLGEIGPAAEAAIPALLAAADADDEELGAAALEAVDCIDPIELENEAA